MKDYNKFWETMKDLHSRHPSVRFRNFLIIKAIQKILDPVEENTILDVGCGDAGLLKQLSNSSYFKGKKAIFSGYDISGYRIEKNRSQGLRFNFRVADFNENIEVNNKFNIIICSEVIEHLKNWRISIENMAAMNELGGYLILTTQSGRRFKSDLALGHLQHFELDYLTDYLKMLGYDIIRAEKRGFPFYNLQKAVNSIFFSVSERIAHTDVNALTSILFDITYFLFRISINSKKLGSQIFILARKSS